MINLLSHLGIVKACSEHLLSTHYGLALKYIPQTNKQTYFQRPQTTREGLCNKRRLLAISGFLVRLGNEV